MTWSTLQMEVTTPLFNGGHDPDGRDADGEDATGIRVPSLLGAMRFWLRAMAGAHVGADLAALHYWEARVFGRAARAAGGANEIGGPNQVGRANEARGANQVGGADGEAASPIQWRIPAQPRVMPASERPAWLPSFGKRSSREQGEDRWIVYLLGQGLGNLRDCTLRRPYVPPGQTFEIRFRPRRDDPTALALALAALWLTCTFGGVGARTRRGFGGLRITGFDPNGLEVPAPWDKLPLAASTDGLYPSLQRLWPEQVGRCLPLFNEPPEQRKPERLHRWAGPPPYPVLGGRAEHAGREVTTALLGSDTFGTWDRALGDVGRRWRLFRADEDAPDNVPYEPKVKTREWAGVIHGGDDRFTLGALGLPVAYKEWQVNLTEVGKHPQDQLRRASPVWIRPVRIGERWRIFTFAFLNALLPTGAGAPEVLVTKHGRRVKAVTIPQEDLDSLVTDWKAVLSPPAG